MKECTDIKTPNIGTMLNHKLLLFFFFNLVFFVIHHLVRVIFRSLATAVGGARIKTTRRKNCFKFLNWLFKKKNQLVGWKVFLKTILYLLALSILLSVALQVVLSCGR